MRKDLSGLIFLKKDDMEERANVIIDEEISNDKLRLGAGYQIGHSFFAPSDPAILLDEEWYARVVRTEIAPLLEEYWFDNAEKAEDWNEKLLDGFR